MAEGREVGDEVGAAEEGVGDRGDFLKTEDKDVRRRAGGEGGEEVGGEDGWVDGFAAAIEGYDVGIESGHCSSRLRG